MESLGQLNMAFDLGGGMDANVEVGGPDQLWIASGPGFKVNDLWIKSGDGLPDIRVRVLRTGKTLFVSVDRGDLHSGWWTPDAAPRLNIALDSHGRTVRVSAGVGDSYDFQEVELGQRDL